MEEGARRTGTWHRRWSGIGSEQKCGQGTGSYLFISCFVWFRESSNVVLLAGCSHFKKKIHTELLGSFI